MALQQRLETASKEFSAVEKDIQRINASRQQYLAQLNENEMVKKEVEFLEKDADIFKMIGPALIKQDRSEALTNVNKRIEFISAELVRIEATFKDLEKKREEKRQKFAELQMQAQQQQQQQQQIQQ
eukprot:TRINITY_DN994_c0_g1_i1.p1 TRINITY_DN994_c0_g1~~TRINITY_DN994_c0_g1_i1.p1  ORF type:complete len:126 (+),score=45.80 TRINITY_DN994_c0_g1_i1:37-414(+)